GVVFMLVKSKGFLFLVMFVLIISLTANIYSFNKLGNNNEEKNKIISDLQKENEKQKYIISKKNETSEIESASKNNEIDNDKTQQEIDENTIKKFIEYTFNTNEDDYVTRKKLAKEYMTDELFKKEFSEDSIDNDEMKILIEVKSVEVFLGSDNNAIAKYVIKETKAQGEYEDEFEKYVNIELKDGKVSNIKALSNEEWGV